LMRPTLLAPGSVYQTNEPAAAAVMPSGAGVAVPRGNSPTTAGTQRSSSRSARGRKVGAGRGVVRGREAQGRRRVEAVMVSISGGGRGRGAGHATSAGSG